MGLLGKIGRVYYREGEIYRVPFGAFRGARLKYHRSMQMRMMLGLYDHDVCRWIASALRAIPGWNESQVVCDLGANSGMYTLWMSRLVPSGRVFAFEPMPPMAARLCETIEINALAHVEVVNAAVGEAVGTVKFQVRGLDGTASSIAGLMQDREDGQTIEVEITSLDAVFSQARAMPAFLKIDVEGALASVLRGAARTIAAQRPVLYVESHSPEEDGAIGALMRKENYEALRWQDRTWVTDPTKTHPSPQGVWGHMLVVPREYREKVAAALGA